MPRQEVKSGTPVFPLQRGPWLLSIKGVMTWAKVTSLVDSEAYHEQMGPIPSLNGGLDIALSNAHT